MTKQGVSLGGLSVADRELALAFAALALPAEQDLTEPGVNARLRHALSEELRFLDTDHVELRRWLVDAGHCRRDGFGRAYRRSSTGTAAEATEGLALALQAASAGSPAAWAEAERERVRAEREARRRAHEQRAAARTNRETP